MPSTQRLIQLIKDKLEAHRATLSSTDRIVWDVQDRYHRDMFLEGHGVWLRKYGVPTEHHVRQRDGVFVIYMAGATCLHCGQEVK